MENSTPPTDTFTPTPNPGDDDVHIVYTKIRRYKEGSWVYEFNENLNYGEARHYELEAKVENDGNTDLEDVDIDYRTDDSKARFDRDDTRLDDDLVDIDEGSSVTKHSGRITITVAQDGQSVRVQGPKAGESFPVVNGFVTIYFFLDVDASGDNDISSNSERAEYAKVEITVTPPPPKYVYVWSATAEGIQDEGSYYYTPINTKSTFNQGEGIYYLAKLESITSSHKLKLEIQHSDGWGWPEEWTWNEVGAGWGYTFFSTIITDPTPGVYTFSLYITTDNVNWELLSVRQAESLANGPSYESSSLQSAKDWTYYGDPRWEYEIINPANTFNVGEDIHFLTTVTEITVDHRFEVEVYYEDDLWWTWGEGETLNVVNGIWGNSYADVVQGACCTGTFKFRTYLITEDGREFLGEHLVTVQ